MSAQPWVLEVWNEAIVSAEGDYVPEPLDIRAMHLAAAAVAELIAATEAEYSAQEVFDRARLGYIQEALIPLQKARARRAAALAAVRHDAARNRYARHAGALTVEQPAVDGDAVELACKAFYSEALDEMVWSDFDDSDKAIIRARWARALAIVYPALQRQIAELTAERDAQSRAYGLILAERDAAVKRADEAERERQIVMDDWNAIEKRVETAEAECDRLRKELQYIADANPLTWDVEVRDQFQEWAQSRARAAIASQKMTQESGNG